MRGHEAPAALPPPNFGRSRSGGCGERHRILKYYGGESGGRVAVCEMAVALTSFSKPVFNKICTWSPARRFSNLFPLLCLLAFQPRRKELVDESA